MPTTAAPPARAAGSRTWTRPFRRSQIPAPQITLVIVTHAGAEVLGACPDACARADLPRVIVDTAGTDATRASARAADPAVTVIARDGRTGCRRPSADRLDAPEPRETPG